MSCHFYCLRMLQIFVRFANKNRYQLRLMCEHAQGVKWTFVSKTYILTLGARGTARTVAKVVFKRHLFWSNVWKSSPRRTLSSPPSVYGFRERSSQFCVFLEESSTVVFFKVRESFRFEPHPATPPPHTHTWISFFTSLLKNNLSQSCELPHRISFFVSHWNKEFFDNVKRKIKSAGGRLRVCDKLFFQKWNEKWNPRGGSRVCDKSFFKVKH